MAGEAILVLLDAFLFAPIPFLFWLIISYGGNAFFDVRWLIFALLFVPRVVRALAFRTQGEAENSVFGHARLTRLVGLFLAAFLLMFAFNFSLLTLSLVPPSASLGRQATEMRGILGLQWGAWSSVVVYGLIMGLAYWAADFVTGLTGSRVTMSYLNQ